WLRFRCAAGCEGPQQLRNQEKDDYPDQKNESQAKCLGAAAAREQGIQFSLVAGFRGDLKAQLVTALRIIACLLLGEIAFIIVADGPRHHQDVEMERVAERKAGRPQLVPRTMRQQHPKTTEEFSSGRRTLEHQAAAIHERLHAAE